MQGNTGQFVKRLAGAFIAAALMGLAACGEDQGKDDSLSAMIGGPFELTDQTGKRVTQADYEGRLMLVYFGFTYCPDICPTALQVMSTALDQLGDKAEKVQPILITVDPERDTPEALAAYMGHFRPGFVGLTGTPEEIAAAASAYKVYYRKSQDPSASDYLMDHTSVVYLMGPKGQFLAHFTHQSAPGDMAARIEKAVDRYF